MITIRKFWSRLGLDFFDAVIWIYGGCLLMLLVGLFTIFWKI